MSCWEMELWIGDPVVQVKKNSPNGTEYAKVGHNDVSDSLVWVEILFPCSQQTGLVS